ncbi:MAG: lipocalin family protein [Saprospiraceae bacterium]
MKNLYLLFVIVLLSCQGEVKFQSHQLEGKWKAIEWKDLTNDKAIDVAVTFEFDNQERYTGNYGSKKEIGKYWIGGDNLHTIEDGKAEKKVKIKKLENDTLIFGMNRMGNLEELILVKE